MIELSPMHFLHGRCCEFAIALARKFGYKIIINFDYNEEGNFLKLIHAYCISNNNNNIELIDVRGVYSKYNTSESFISDNEFEYNWDYNAELELNIDEAIEFLSKNLKICKFLCKKQTFLHAKSVTSFFFLLYESIELDQTNAIK